MSTLLSPLKSASEFHLGWLGYEPKALMSRTRSWMSTFPSPFMSPMILIFTVPSISVLSLGLISPTTAASAFIVQRWHGVKPEVFQLKIKVVFSPMPKSVINIVPMGMLSR